MKPIIKTFVALAFGTGVLAMAQASATYRPDHCPTNHDHRSHHANYYDYYPADRYYRAGPYRSKRTSRYDRRHDRYDRYDRYDDHRYDRRRGHRYDRYRPRSRVVHRETFPTRFRARITVVEEIYWTRSGRRQLVCSVVVRGPEADYVPNRRLRRLANRNCSRRARIQYL